MAERWSLKEDIIIAKFCEENQYRYLSDKYLDELMNRLDAEGFVGRSRRAVSTRANWYIDLHWKGESPYAVQQVRRVAELFSHQMREYRLAVQREVEENYEPEGIAIETIAEAKALQGLGQCPNNLTGYLYRIEFNQTFPMMLQKYLDLKGLKNKDVYNKIYMKADTFSSILRGKNQAVKKENVLRLCVGLQLTVEEAEEFMASAGYLFSNAIMTDVVVKSNLKYKCYDTYAIDEELVENDADVLFALK